MKKPLTNFAFIDSQNLNLSVRDQGWKLNWKKLRKYLLEKYGVKKAYLFLGYLPSQKNLYKSLKSYGFEIIFKETFLINGSIKGNVDAELVLQTMIDFKKYKKAILISGDGDFACLVKYLIKKDKLCRIIIPNKYKYSVLLRKSGKGFLDFVSHLKNKLEYK